MFWATGGMLYGTREEEIAVGTWHITPDGHFCGQWHVWDRRRERCFVVYWEGETFQLSPKDRVGKEMFGRVPGNPEGY
jgi:hypothetical protein